MTNRYLDSRGCEIVLGRKLGHGGEGSVFEVVGSSSLVAKIYSAPQNDRKQSKIRFMVANSDPSIYTCTAWPKEPLRQQIGGGIVGFVMPKVSDHFELYVLYGTAHRRKSFPDAHWGHLVLAARNIAAAFHSIHDHGHVIGDVNQRNILVGADSRITIIDTDSFQINENGHIHICSVGASHFTPPELQGTTNFRTIPRTVNHDNFGLAVLIFHLLFCGRHPYSGVPLRTDVGNDLEEDIRAFRYAYARDGVNRGFRTPPGAIPIGLLPNSMQEMFTLAFTENGVSNGRPTSGDWVLQLDKLFASLVKCTQSKSHYYPRQENKCPWCLLDNSGLVFFVDLTPVLGLGINLENIWSRIEAIRIPHPESYFPKPNAASSRPMPLPIQVDYSLLVKLLQGAIGLVSVFLVVKYFYFDYFPLFIFIGVLAFIKVEQIGTAAISAEKASRNTKLDFARKEFDQLCSTAEQFINIRVLYDKKQTLMRLRAELQQLPGKEALAIQKLTSSAERRQLDAFLGQLFIEDAQIEGVGPTRKAALRSFGIETAADVDWNKVIAVSGFGEYLTSSLVKWRKSCETRFSFNPNTKLSESEIQAVRRTISLERQNIEKAISSGAAALQILHARFIEQERRFMPQLQKSCAALSQAMADVTVF